jgi:hypothetical protein
MSKFLSLQLLSFYILISKGTEIKQLNFIISLIRFLSSKKTERSYDITYNIKYSSTIVKLINSLSFGQKINITIGEKVFSHLQRGSKVPCGEDCAGMMSNNEVEWDCADYPNLPRYTDNFVDYRGSFEQRYYELEDPCCICGGTGWTRAFYNQTITIRKDADAVYKHMLFMFGVLPRDVINIIVDLMNQL